jgi:hypothetical protein
LLLRWHLETELRDWHCRRSGSDRGVYLRLLWRKTQSKGWCCTLLVLRLPAAGLLAAVRRTKRCVRRRRISSQG